MEEDPDVEVAEEADLSLNASLADSQSTFGEGRYRDFDDETKDFSQENRSDDRFEDNEEPRLKYDRLSSDLKEILSSDSTSAMAVNEKFIVVGKSCLCVCTQNEILVPHTVVESHTSQNQNLKQDI